jgi:hypothetical protein
MNGAVSGLTIPGAMDAAGLRRYAWLSDGNPIAGQTTATYLAGDRHLPATRTTSVTANPAPSKHNNPK